MLSRLGNLIECSTTPDYMKRKTFTRLYRKYSFIDCHYFKDFEAMWNSGKDSLIQDATRLLSAHVGGETLISYASKDLNKLEVIRV